MADIIDLTEKLKALKEKFVTDYPGTEKITIDQLLPLIELVHSLARANMNLSKFVDLLDESLIEYQRKMKKKLKKLRKQTKRF